MPSPRAWSWKEVPHELNTATWSCCPIGLAVRANPAAPVAHDRRGGAATIVQPAHTPNSRPYGPNRKPL
jgi:hypothetical protein